MTGVPVPERLARLPRDGRGLPVPWVTGTVDGIPRLGVNDAARCAEAIVGRLCGQCGDRLGYWCWLVGDAECVRRREFVEPAMHEECARYAFAVCPYLASPTYEARRLHDGVVQIADRRRPDRMGLYRCRGYEPLYASPLPMVRARPAASVEWF